MDPKWNEPAVGFEPTPADYNQLLYQLSYTGISLGKYSLCEQTRL
jgi:hypothetical protein